MRKWLSVPLAAGLLLYPFATSAEDYGSKTKQTQQVPPVAQALVREGDFAIKLAAELNLGLPTTDAEAEDMLARAGVVPLNGWISDYPMTPEIIGQLEDSLAAAAAEGSLPMTAEEATERLFALAEQMSLPVPAGPETPSAQEGTAAVEQAPPAAVHHHYYDYGPPIVTYYPPPVHYAYLYTWVPYPSWWFGFWFPGYYICRDFSTVIVVRTKRAIVTNRIIHPVTRKVIIVDPVVRTKTGKVIPRTVLRTRDGRTFRDFSEVRSDIRKKARAPDRRSKSARRTGGYRSPEARKGAEAIFNRSLERMRAGGRHDDGMIRGTEQSISPRTPKRMYKAPVTRGNRESVRPFKAPRGPSRDSKRRYLAPGMPEQSHNAPEMRGTRPMIAPQAPARKSERRFVAPGARVKPKPSVTRPSVSPRAPSRGKRSYAAPSTPAKPFSDPAIKGDRESMRSFPGAGGQGRGGFGHDFPDRRR